MDVPATDGRPASALDTAPALDKAAALDEAPATVGEADGRRLRGDRTRRAILAEATDLASVEGLEGLSIGRLATALGVSKSGLFAHFGSKRELQLATIDAAAELFEAAVWTPVAGLEHGLARLAALLDAWVAYFSADVFRGGCFFANVQHEFDSRPGPVRDRIAAHRRRWADTLVAHVREAQRRGQLAPELDPAQIAFELDAFPLLANSRYQLTGDATAFDHAAAAIRRTLDSAAPTP
jgi:AcrR family transcriptional regulator